MFASLRGFLVNQAANGVARGKIDAGGPAGADCEETFFGGKRVTSNLLRRDKYRTECWDARSTKPEESHYSSYSLLAPSKCGRTSPRQFDMYLGNVASPQRRRVLGILTLKGLSSVHRDSLSGHPASGI